MTAAGQLTALTRCSAALPARWPRRSLQSRARLIRRWGVRRPPRSRNSGRCSRVWFVGVAAGRRADCRFSCKSERLRSAHRVGSLGRTIETGAIDPPTNNTRVLPRRKVRLFAEPAREQILAHASTEDGQPFDDRAARLLGDLELHRSAGLFLDHRRSIPNSPGCEHVINPQPRQVASPELAVDWQVEHGKIAPLALQLEATPTVQTSFGFNGRF